MFFHSMEQLSPRSIWFFFLISLCRVFPILSLVVFGVIISFFLQGANIENMKFLLSVFVFFSFFGIAFYIWAKLIYKFYRFELRSDGFRKELGVIYKSYVTIPYDKIQNVNITRGIIERILGLSSLSIETAGASSVEKVSYYKRIGAEGFLTGLSEKRAEEIRTELLKRTNHSSSTITN